MDGAGADKDEPARAGRTRRFDQLQGTDHVLLSKADDVPFAAAKRAAGTPQGGVNDRVAAADQVLGSLRLAQPAGHPIDLCGDVIQGVGVAFKPTPAAQRVPAGQQLTHHEAAQKTGGARHGDLHGTTSRVWILSSNCFFSSPSARVAACW